jgi:hypothetical protein
MQQRYAQWAAKQPRPDTKLVDRVESLLAKEPCVGSLDKWTRVYAYNRLPRKAVGGLPKEAVDRGIVDFHLEAVGVGNKPERHITEPNSWVTMDDRPIKMADGDYDLKDNRIRFSFCGNNLGPSMPPAINNMATYFDELERRRSAHAP